MKACQTTEPCTMQKQVEHPHKLKLVGYRALFLHTEATVQFCRKAPVLKDGHYSHKKVPPNLQLLTQETVVLSAQEKKTTKPEKDESCSFLLPCLPMERMHTSIPDNLLLNAEIR